MSTIQACTTVPSQGPATVDARRGLLLGAFGVVIFALTFPMTRMAVGSAEDPQLPPAFVAVARAAGAGLISLVYLLACRASLPKRIQLPALALSALGTVFGFPLSLALALREVPSMHAAVVTGITPLTTAAFAAIALRQRASASFWACAVLGCILVVAFATERLASLKKRRATSGARRHRRWPHRPEPAIASAGSPTSGSCRIWSSWKAPVRSRA